MNFRIVTSSLARRTMLNRIMSSYIEQLNLSKNKGSIIVTLHNNMKDDGAMIYHFTDSGPIALIALNSKLSKESLLRALAHEMVHVKQHAKGHLVDTSTGSTWRGKKFSNKQEKKLGYLNLPWEVEAFSKQEMLLRCALES